MKKFLSLLLAATMLTSATFAQAKKQAAKTAAPAPAATTAHAKKDGTPDKRYKENKTAAAAPAATTHVKKDGTPDKRYKENKKAAPAPAKKG